MRVRRAHDDEIGDILAMDRECFPQDWAPHTGEHVAWWIAEGAGYTGAYHSVVLPEAFYMHRVGVLPCARGQRLSEKLVRAVMRHAARVAGCVGVITDTNSPAMANALYRCGWKMFTPEGGGWARPESVYFRWVCG